MIINGTSVIGIYKRTSGNTYNENDLLIYENPIRLRVVTRDFTALENSNESIEQACNREIRDYTKYYDEVTNGDLNLQDDNKLVRVADVLRYLNSLPKACTSEYATQYSGSLRQLVKAGTYHINENTTDLPHLFTPSNITTVRVSKLATGVVCQELMDYVLKAYYIRCFAIDSEDNYITDSRNTDWNHLNELSDVQNLLSAYIDAKNTYESRSEILQQLIEPVTSTYRYKLTQYRDDNNLVIRSNSVILTNSSTQRVVTFVLNIGDNITNKYFVNITIPPTSVANNLVIENNDIYSIKVNGNTIYIKATSTIKSITSVSVLTLEIV